MNPGKKRGFYLVHILHSNKPIVNHALLNRLCQQLIHSVGTTFEMMALNNREDSRSKEVQDFISDSLINHLIKRQVLITFSEGLDK